MSRSLLERLSALERSVGRQDGADGSAVHRHHDAGGTNGIATQLDGATANSLEALGFEPMGGSACPFYRRILRYDILTRHGCASFVDLLDTDLNNLVKAAKEAEPGTQLLFYDTETTGLGTGAGTFPFLHAVGQFEDDEYVIYQYFLDDYSAEGSLLETLLTEHFLRRNAMVITFNGKSFDVPLLRNRLVLHRMPGLKKLAHVDLLYPSRRLWKQRLPSVSLGSVEQGILGLEREADVPGKEAPERYFRYYEERDASIIEPVLEHNATDVCSLASLSVVLAETMNGCRTVDSAQEHLALAQWNAEWGDHDLAERCFTAATHCTDVTWRALWLRTMFYKRQRRWAEAVQAWTELAQAYDWSVLPMIEIAKYHEHQNRDYREAQMWTQRALDRLYLREDDPRLLQELGHRLQRVQRKAGHLESHRSSLQP